jgi:hypothetical protein
MTDPHAPTAPDPNGHGHDDAGHDHHEESLGPVDLAAWGAGIAGLAVSIAIAACFVLATSGIG